MPSLHYRVSRRRSSGVTRGAVLPRGLHRRPSHALVLVAGRSNAPLAARIAHCLGVRLGDVELETFSSGEIYCRFGQSIRGADVFIVQSGCAPVNDHLLELLLLINAARLASAHRITAVMPLYPYARQDKKSVPREPISARLVATMLEAAGADRILTMDLHAAQIQGFFTIPVNHMTALPLFADYYRRRGLSGSGVVSVSPDLGRVKAARRLAQALDCSFAVVAKVRPAHELATATELVGRVEGKIALLGDDMAVTGRTLVAAACALREAGAREVRAFATHALLTPPSIEELAAPGLTQLTVTDTVPLMHEGLPGNVDVLSVAELLARAIRNVFEDRSVSALFAGANEL